MKPTRIIKPLRLIDNEESKRNGCGAPKMHVADCNNGQRYTIAELAKIIGITPGGLWVRLRKYGWSSPFIFFRLTAKGLRFTGESIRNNVEPGNWGNLGSKVRARNLSKIKTGTWEARQR